MLLLEVVSEGIRLQLVRKQAEEAVKIANYLDNSKSKFAVPIITDKIIIVSTGYQILRQDVANWSSQLRLVCSTETCEEAVKQLGHIIADMTVKEYVPNLSTYDILSHKSVRKSKTYTFSNGIPRIEYKGVGFTLISQNKSWTIRRGKLVRLTTYKMRDQWNGVFKQPKNFSEAIQAVIDASE